MSLRREGLHAAPMHESWPVAWRWLRDKLRAASDRRPAVQPARPPARVQTRLLQGEPEAGPASIPSGPAGAVPVPPVTGTAPRTGEYPYPPEGIEDLPRLPVFDNSAEAARKLLDALEAMDGGTEAAT